jgi:hypothetical protein
MIRWGKGDPLMAKWLVSNVELVLDEASGYTASKWIRFAGWKGLADVDEARTLDGIIQLHLLMVEESKVVMQQSELNVPDTVTPRELLKILNKGVIDWHAGTWAVDAGRPIAEPEFRPGFCLTKRCPNAAFVYMYCTDCARRKDHVEARKSTLNTPTTQVGLGLFAAKKFAAGEYITTWSWDMQFVDDSSTIT